MFLNISKAFDRVWLEGLIYKIKCMGVKGDLLALMKSFLFERQQKVVLNGQESEWLTIKAGVPQGSSLGLLHFLKYVNDLLDNLEPNVKLLRMILQCFRLFVTLSIPHYIDKVSYWASKWEMSFNSDPSKETQEAIFSRKINEELSPTSFI